MDRLPPFRSSSRPTPPDETEIVGIDDETAEAVLEALSSETTRAVLRAVYEESGTASEIADRVDTSLQNVGYHLDKLQEVDLVEVADTWRSAQGNEMDVYAPTNESVVLIAGDERTTSSLRDRLRRILGSGVALVAGSVIVEESITTSTTLTYQRRSSNTPTWLDAFVPTWISAGTLFLTGGLFVLVLWFVLSRGE